MMRLCYPKIRLPRSVCPVGEASPPVHVDDALRKPSEFRSLANTLSQPTHCFLFVDARKCRTAETEKRTSFIPGTWTGATTPRWSCPLDESFRGRPEVRSLAPFFSSQPQGVVTVAPALGPPTHEFPLDLARVRPSVSPLSLLPATSSLPTPYPRGPTPLAFRPSFTW